MSYYKINGTDLTTQPSQGRWVSQEPLGIDGNGHGIYPRYHEYELTWELIDLASASQLQTFFDNMLITGTITADLPKFNDNGLDSTFQTYSGCVLRQPQFDPYFESHRTNVRVPIVKIKVA